MPTEQLLHYNQGCTKVTLSPQILDRPGTASCGPLPPDYFFFYSNNPEDIRGTVQTSTELADNGYWLLKSPSNPRVQGVGRIFIWHRNALSVAINEALVIYNPNAFDIHVAVFAAGVTNIGDGIGLWYNFYLGGLPTITVPAGGFNNLFLSSVAPNGIYGVVATIKITDTSELTVAPAELYDLAWISNSGGATQQAPADGSSRVRGQGTGFTAGVIINQMNVTGALSTPQGFTVAANTDTLMDSFHGDDVPYVYDPDPTQGAARLQGCYGVDYYNLVWNAKNDDSVNRTVTFYAGNSGNTDRTNFCIKSGYTTQDNGFGGCNNLALLPNEYIAFLRSTNLPPGATIGFGFTLVTVGGFSYPLTLCMGAA